MSQEGVCEQQTFQELLNQFFSGSNTDSPLYKSKHLAWNHFLTLGLPSKESGPYRYIKLRNLFAQKFSSPPNSDISKELVAPHLLPECKESCLVFVNGDFYPSLSSLRAIQDRLTISSLDEAAKTFGTLLNNQWIKSLKEESDPFAALNGALHKSGAFLYLPPKTEIEPPIQILHLVDTQHGLCMALPRLHIFLASFSSASFCFTQHHLSEGGYFTNQVVEFALEEGASASYAAAFCNEGEERWNLGAIRASLKKNASFSTVVVTEGSMTDRFDYRVALLGEGAEASLNGISLLQGKREAHANVRVDHQAPRCTSNQIFKSVLRGASRSGFEGKIIVRQAAQKTQAFQINNNLLLDSAAGVYATSKPGLEIDADDVKATHGSTTGRLDPEQLFYMKSRGLSESAAKSLLVSSFCDEVISLFPIESIAKQIRTRLATSFQRG